MHKIVHPYFYFRIDDIFGVIKGSTYPKIKELPVLFFKKNEEFVLSKKEEKRMLHAIKMLNIGIVQLINVDLMGTFIQVDYNYVNVRNK